MAAPKRPNPTNAAAARRQIGDQTCVDRLRKNGYQVTKLEEAAEQSLFSSFDEAERVNVYSLARRWADVSSKPIMIPAEVAVAEGIEVRGLEHEIDELATLAALAKRTTGWLPLAIHHVVLAGGTAQQVSNASGLSIQEAAGRWLKWAQGQRGLLADGGPLARLDARDKDLSQMDEVQALLTQDD